MVGADLRTTASRETMPVVLAHAEDASGLAEMVHQFLEQALADSPRKARRARRLSGTAVLRSAEDEAIAVRLHFAGDRIELSDGAASDSGAATITADFLTIAHLASGQESPFRLFADRRLKVRFSLTDVPFLLGLLSVMRSRPPSPQAQRSHRRLLIWIAVSAAAAGAGGLGWWWFAGAP